MKKVSWILALIVLVSLSGVVAAQGYPNTHNIEFVVNVEPWAEFDMPLDKTLDIKDGARSGAVNAQGTITANIPLTIQIDHTPFSDVEAINNFFYYTFIKDDGSSSSTMQTAGGTCTKNARQGVTDLHALLQVFAPNWYDLTAWEYKSTVTITILAF